MNTQTQAIPGAAVRGVASGVFFMAFFSTLWAGIACVWVVLGFGAALIMWAVGLGLLLLGKRLPSSYQPLPQSP